MKALIHNGRVVELHETGFPVHEAMQWVDAPEGVTTEWRYENGEFFPPEEPQPTTEEIIADYEAALDSFLDSVALTYRYGVNGQIPPRYSLVVRTGFPNDDQQLAVAFGAWMDICNGIAKAKLNEVLAGHAAMPTKEEFITSLPSFVFP